MGIGTSSERVFENELDRICAEIPRIERATRLKEKVAIISDIYFKSYLLNHIKTAYGKRQLFSISTNVHVCNGFDTGFIGILYPKKSEAKTKLALEPLLAYFLKIQARQNGIDDAGSILSVDTLRINTKNKFTLFCPELKIGTNILPDNLFSTLIMVVKNAKESYGIRISLTSTREDVWNKYEHLCYVCKIKLNSKTYEMGHIKPVCEGGLSSIENLRPTCLACNRSMGSMNLYEYILKHDLSGKDLIPDNDKILWTSVINLTTLFAIQKPNIVTLPLAQRLKSIADIIENR